VPFQWVFDADYVCALGGVHYTEFPNHLTTCDSHGNLSMSELFLLQLEITILVYLERGPWDHWDLTGIPLITHDLHEMV
jgi:hypothetical protein